MKYLFAVALASAAFAQQQKCQTLEECQARLDAATYQVEKLYAEAAQCQVALLRIRAIQLPDDLAKRVEAAAPKTAKADTPAEKKNAEAK